MTDYDQGHDRYPTNASSRRSLLHALGATAAVGLTGTGHAVESGRQVGSVSEGRDGRSSPPPGPPVLHEEPAVIPQLAPAGEWHAEPLLVCGQTAYDDGEFLYQGWPYDDHGGLTPGAPIPQSWLFLTVGGLVYPTDTGRYANNAADILEIRVQPTEDGVRYRIAFTTMVDPDAAVVALGIDTGSGDRTEWGHGLGELGAPVDHVAVVSGTHASLDGSPLSADHYEVRLDRNQLVVDLPLSPGRDTWRHYAVAGVHDGDGGFTPVLPRPDDRQPGGARGDVPPVFDVGFRTEADEPRSRWRELKQAVALGVRDISSLGADVDFARLQDGDVDRPTDLHGYHNRVYASRYEFGAGIGSASELFDEPRGSDAVPFAGAGAALDAILERAVPPGAAEYGNGLGGDGGYGLGDDGEYGLGDDGEYGLGNDGEWSIDLLESLLLGRVQPYGIYVPESYDPGTPAPVHVQLPAFGQNYNHYAAEAPGTLGQFGEHRDAIVIVPHGRGPAGWWANEAELAVFEAWADARAHYAMDLDRATVGGYSMGGYGGYKLAAQYPDLFAACAGVVAPFAIQPDWGGHDDTGRAPLFTDLSRLTDNLRHVSTLIWAGKLDPLVPYPTVSEFRRRLADHGYRHRVDTFLGIGHFGHYLLDEWGPARDYLDGVRATREPGHVTYRAVPSEDAPAFDLVHDGAYWVQDVQVADDTDDGLVDAISLADGHAEPESERVRGIEFDPALHTQHGLDWTNRVPARSPENALEVTLDGVTHATLYVDEAGIDPTESVELRIESTHEATLTLRSGVGERTHPVPSGASSTVVDLRG